MSSGNMRRGQKRTYYQPKFEQLEDRWCPSVTVTAVATPAGNQLKIAGDIAADAINITDLGNGHVDVTGASGCCPRFGRQCEVDLFFDSRPRHGHHQLHACPSAHSFGVDPIPAGSWRADRATLDFTKGIHGGSLAVVVQGGSGDDAVSVTLGTLTAAHASVSVAGGEGNDDISVLDAQADIAVGSSLLVQLNGGGGNNSVTTAFTGLIFGTLSVAAYGGPGSCSTSTSKSRKAAREWSMP